MNRLNVIVCSIGVMLGCLPSRVESQDCLLYSIRPDGSGLKIEAEAGIDPALRVYGSPDISPSGDRLIFDAYSRVGFARFAKILVLQLTGDSTGQVDDYDCGNCPVWSPDGKRIAFEVCSLNPLNLESGVWMMNADGSDAERLSEGEQPRWFPDGKFVISTLLQGGMRFLKVDLKTKDATPFLDKFQHEEPVRFSRDGTRVLAHVLRNGKPKLISMASDGDEDSIVELSDLSLSCPVFSPDGKWIAFATSNEKDGEFIQIIAADGKAEPRKLIFAPQAHKQDLCWHPDGKRIVFVSNQLLPVEKDK
jgi:Tol biopolymer transport system component